MHTQIYFVGPSNPVTIDGRRPGLTGLRGPPQVGAQGSLATGSEQLQQSWGGMCMQQ